MAERAEPPRSGEPDPVPAFEDLDADQHRILAYASAIGPEFDFALLVGAMGIDEEILAEQVERLVHRGILRERPGGDRFGFVEEEFRARIYRSLTESRLRVLHRKIAEVLEQSHPRPSPAVLSELGRHYFLGKVPEKSYAYNREAAEIARAADEPEVAASHLERVLLDLAALGGDRRHEQAEVAEALGELYYSMGRFPAADRSFGEALELLGGTQPRVRARLLLARAEVARENLDVDTAVQGALAAQKLFEAADDRLGVAQTYRLLGRLEFQRGAYREALDESMRALDQLGVIRDPRFLGRLSIDIGNSFALLGPDVRSVAIEWYERAIDRLREAGDWVELARAYHNLGVAVGETRPQDGLEYLEQAREAGDRAHDTRSTGRALLSGVEMRLALGQLDEAHRDNEQAGRLLVRLSDDLGIEQVTQNRGLIAEKRGQWEEAEQAYLSAAEMCERLRLPADRAEVEYYLARLRHKTRDLEGARAAYRKASELGLPQARPNLAAAFEELGHQLGEPTAAPTPAPVSLAVEPRAAPDERGL
jgi:tetratricopeptide (TPR) repeat protein